MSISYPPLSNDQIYSMLYSRLKLYTALWFATLTDPYFNLQFTAVLIQIFVAKQILDLTQ